MNIQQNILQTVSLAGFLAQRSQWMEGAATSRTAGKAEKVAAQSRQSVEEVTKNREGYLTKVAEKLGGTPEEIEEVREGAQLEEPIQTKTWEPYKQSIANAAQIAQQAYYTSPSVKNLQRWQKYAAEMRGIKDREDITREHFENYPRGSIGAIKDRLAAEAEADRVRMANREANRIAFARNYTFYPEDSSWDW